MKTIRWGIIGVGDVTEVKSGPAFYKAENSELVAVMRRDSEKAADYAKRHHVPQWYDDGDALINDPEVDVVYIATPQHVHKKYTLKAAAAGKHVYVEKPMALNYADCQAMIEACKQAGVSLWVAYYRRAMPRFVKIKELIENGAIGVPLGVSVQMFKPTRIQPKTPLSSLPWRVQTTTAGSGGELMDVACHQVDLLNYYFGDITSVDAFALNQSGLYPAADTASATFQFESGIIGSALWCFTAGTHIDETVIVGSKGQISFASFAPTPFTLATADGTQTFDIGYPEHVQQPLIETIIAELNGQGKCPSTGTTAAHTNYVFDQIFERYQHESPA